MDNREGRIIETKESWGLLDSGTIIRVRDLGSGNCLFLGGEDSHNVLLSGFSEYLYTSPRGEVLITAMSIPLTIAYWMW